jgi:superfamily II DNA or RNA helicase
LPRELLSRRASATISSVLAMAGVSPRRWQTEALDAWVANDMRGVASVVTGGGKTVLALLAFQKVLEANPEAHLVVIVPTLALLDQWAVTLIADFGFTEEEIALVSGESPKRRARLATIVVINTARKRSADLTAGSECLLVVDECHRAGSPENAKALDVPVRYTLGLSATPRREFDDGFEVWVEPRLGPVVYEYGYAQARRDGLIPRLEILNFQFALTEPEQRSYDRLTSRIAARWGREEDPHSDPILKRLLIQRSRVSTGSPGRVVGAVALAERYPQRGLVFHEQIARAETITRLLDRRGVRVAIYHSKLGPSVRRRNLELFRFGQVTKLVTCRALDEGLNVPDAEVAIIAAATTSSRQRIQRLGRVLRATEGKDVAVICTLFATESERNRLDEEASDLADVAAVRWFELKT